MPTTGPSPWWAGGSLAAAFLTERCLCTGDSGGWPQPVCHNCCTLSSQGNDALICTLGYNKWAAAGVPVRASWSTSTCHTQVPCHPSCEAQTQTIAWTFTGALGSPKRYDTERAHLSRVLPEPCQAQAGQCHTGPRAWIKCQKSRLSPSSSTNVGIVPQPLN